MLRLTFRAKRAGLVIILLSSFFSLANLLLNWGVFAEYDGEVFALHMVALFIYIYVIGPTQKEIQEYRKLKDSE